MADRPGYFSELTASTGKSGGVVAPIDLYKPEYQGMEQFGKGLANVGEDLLIRAERIKKENEQIVVADLGMQYERMGLQRVFEAKDITGANAVQSGDNPGVTKTYADILEKDKEDILSQFTGDLQQRKQLNSILDTHVNHFLAQIATHENHQRDVYKHQTLEAQYTNLVTGFNEGGNLENATRVMDSAIDYVNPNRDNQTLKDLYNARLTEHWQKFKNQSVLDENYVKLKSDATDANGNVDYNKAINTLLTVKYQQDNHIGPQLKDKLFNELKAEQAWTIAQDNAVATKNYNDDLDKIGSKWIKGDVRGAVEAVKSSKYINDIDKVKIIRQIQTPPPEGKSNSTTYLAGIEKMYDPSIPVEDKKVWLLSNRSGLNMSDFKHLSNVGMSQERTNEKAAITAGVKEIQNILLPKGLKDSPTAKDRAQQAVDLYLKGVQEYHDQLKTPSDVKDYYKQVLSMPQFSNVNVLQDKMTDLQRLKSTMNKTGGNIVGHKDGKPVYDLGNGKWQIGD